VINLLPAHLEATYLAIHAAAPNAEIIVLGYPLLFPQNTTTSCTVGTVLGKTFTLNAGDQNWLDDMGTQLNQAVSTAVADVAGQGVNIHYVDPTSAFSGHAICSAQPWINGLIGFYKFPFKLVNPASFHPNATGQEEYADLVNGCLDGSVTC
jgi:hypothetical protein